MEFMGILKFRKGTLLMSGPAEVALIITGKADSGSELLLAAKNGSAMQIMEIMNYTPMRMMSGNRGFIRHPMISCWVGQV